MSGWWIALLVIVGLYGVYRAFYVEPNLLVVERHTVPIPNLPPGFHGVEIVHLSDLHLEGRVGDREHRLIETVRSLQAPLLLFTGDLISEDRAIANLVPLLMELNRESQGFAVLGNVDYRPPGRTERLRAVLEGAGITVLANRAVTLTAESDMPGRGGAGREGDRAGEGARARPARLWLVGIDDPVTGRANVEQAFAEVKPGAPVIALAHSPDVAEEAIAKGASLVLCGHTHGGQINLPLVGPVVTETKAGRRLARGLKQVGQGWVYVNRGFGTARIAARFLCPPEVAVLTLVRQES